MASDTAPSGSCQSVRISLIDLRSRETYPNRVIYLLPPSFEIRIGRGSQTEQHLHPLPSNTWFSSRVMSREHAVLRADPNTKQVTLEDVGSMHGTYIEGIRLLADEHVPLREREMIQFGTEIVRGDQTYKPLELMIEIDWYENTAPPIPRSRPDWFLTTKNSFSVDFSDEEYESNEEDDDDDEDDIELIYESIRTPDTGLDRPSRTFSVPDSDSSFSETGKPAEESAPTSPADTTDALPKTIYSSSTMIESSSEKHNASEPHDAPGSSLQAPLDVSDDESEAAESRDVVADEINHDYVDSDSDILDEQMDSDKENEYDHEDQGNSDVDPDEEQEHVWDETHRHDSSTSEIQPSSGNHLRAPSPSDAAMPKSTIFPQPNLPTIQNLVDQGPPQPVFTNSFANAPMSITPYQNFAYYSGTGWLNEDGNVNFSTPCRVGFELPLYQQPQNVRPMAPQCHTSHVDLDMTNTNLMTNSVTRSEEKSTPSASKISINNIIDDMHPGASVDVNSRKRKADALSTSDHVDYLLTGDGVQWGSLPAPQDTAATVEVSDANDSTNKLQPVAEDSCSSDIFSEQNTVNKKTVTFAPDAVIIDPESSERPRKRAKTEKNKRSNALGYVATAVVGATLGAVGTFFGLVALPADYFV